jgi:hypothetical protein
MYPKSREQGQAAAVKKPARFLDCETCGEVLQTHVMSVVARSVVVTTLAASSLTETVDVAQHLLNARRLAAFGQAGVR